MAEERVTSLAFGNKRKRILFAHTEENSSPFPHKTQTPRAGLPEDTHAPPSFWSTPAPGSGQASISSGRQSSEPRGQRGWVRVLVWMRDTEGPKEGQGESLRV